MFNNYEERYDHFVILDLTRSTPDRPVFWKAEDLGYALTPFTAGLYDVKTVIDNWNYYNDGIETIAIPLNYFGLASIGFTCSFDPEKAIQLLGHPKPVIKTQDDV